MTKKILCMVLLLAAVCARTDCVQAAGRHLMVTTEHTPKTAMLENGRVTGFATEKFREIMKRTGNDAQFEVMPWKRAYLMALRQNDTCVFPTARTPEREKQFRWVGPSHFTDWTLYGRADHRFALRVLDDAR